MQQFQMETAMLRPLIRPAGLALFLGLIALGGSAAEAGSFGANLNIRTQSFSQPVFAGGRQPNVGLGTSTTPPPYSYGRPGTPRVHEFDNNTQFDGTTDSSANWKLHK
jgi:hypothetical protein